MGSTFGDARLAESFQSVSLSGYTIQRRAIDAGQQVTKTMSEMITSSFYLSLCLDESTHQLDMIQLLILTFFTQKVMFLKKNYLIYDLFMVLHNWRIQQKKSFDEIGGFDKCSINVTDGAAVMAGEKSWFVEVPNNGGIKIVLHFNV